VPAPVQRPVCVVGGLCRACVWWEAQASVGAPARGASRSTMSSEPSVSVAQTATAHGMGIASKGGPGVRVRVRVRVGEGTAWARVGEGRAWVGVRDGVEVGVWGGGYGNGMVVVGGRVRLAPLSLCPALFWGVAAEVRHPLREVGEVEEVMQARPEHRRSHARQQRVQRPPQRHRPARAEHEAGAGEGESA